MFRSGVWLCTAVSDVAVPRKLSSTMPTIQLTSPAAEENPNCGFVLHPSVVTARPASPTRAQRQHVSPTSKLRRAHGPASLGGRPAHGCAYCVMPMRTLAAASRRAFDERPLVVILIVGAALRLIAAIFSRGFFTIDDHHVLIDTADRVARGVPLPVNYGRSILYPGSVALIMDAVRAVAQASPAVEMAVVRLVHGAFSVLSVYFAYRILEHVAGREAARVGGLLLATFYLLPATSVHQFEEPVCPDPILASCWWLLKADEPARGAGLWSFLSGAAIATSLLIRFPALPYVAAFVAVALWRPAARSSKLSFALGVL